MPKKIILEEHIIHEMCKLFREGTAIPGLMSKYNLGRNKITSVLKHALGNDYHACAMRIIALSGKKAAIKNRGRKNPHTLERNAKIGASQRGKKLSIETRQKIATATRTRHERGTWTKEQHHEAIKRVNGYYKIHAKRHSEWMKKLSHA